jgi:hypothetical protein
MFCDRCGTTVPASATQCPRCAAPLAAVAIVPAAAPRGATAWITDGWNAVTANFWVFIALTLIYFAAGSTVPVLLQAPLGFGLQWAALRQVSGRRADFNDLTVGFPPAVLVALTSGAIIIAASLCLLIPGLIAIALLQFPALLVIDRKLDFWSAIKESVTMSQKHFGSMAAFLALEICVFLGGALLCGVGILVAIPVMYAATAAAYIDLFGLREDTKAAIAGGFRQ